MNIHPIFVHFPIALLTIYSVLELIRFNKILNLPYWFYVKAIFVIFGSLGAVAAFITGRMSAQGIPVTSELFRIVEMHERFAIATNIIFGILALSYLVLWLNKENISRFFINKPRLAKIWTIKLNIAKFVVETKLVILLALAGLICITITGGIGGAMVFGPDADPFFKPMYMFLFPEG